MFLFFFQCYGIIKNEVAIKEFFQQFNFLAQCKKYGISLWQCPSFLFLVMGVIIIISVLTIYAIGLRYIEDPQLIVLIVLLVTAILFIIAFIITRSFERLAEASRMKTEFINIVSHQLRSPLSNIRWAIELLMSGKLGRIEEKQTEYFRILKENSARMGELVSDLLVVSKLETGRLPLKKRKFSLVDLTKDLISQFKPFARASNVEIILKSQSNLPLALADSDKIRLVIENLLDNAIRYIKDKGRVEIRIKPKNKSIHFEIEDNGVGIPRQDQKYIFQKFFRAENVMKYQTQGSGLGLYISKSIIERSGGKIGFKSEENKGSTFWFTLPIKDKG